MLFLEVLLIHFFLISVKTFTITLMNSKESTVRLKPVLWRPANELNLNMLSNGEDGTIFTIACKSHRKLMRLDIYNGHFRLQIDDQNHDFPGLTNHFVTTERWVNIHIKQVRNSLILTIDQMKSVLLLGRRRHWSIRNWQDVTLGVIQQRNSQTPVESMVGCIELFHNNSLILDDYAEKVHGINMLCVDACQIQSCENNGRCVNKFNHIACDCEGTGYEGSTCGKKARAVYIDERSFIKFRRTDVLRHMFSLRFKTTHSSGILLTQTAADDSSQLMVELINGTLYVNFSSVVDFRLNIGENLHDNQWHYLKLTVTHERIETQLDNHVDVTAVYESQNSLSPWLSHHVSGSVGGTSDIATQSTGKENYIGCIQQVYIDGYDVIDDLLDVKSVISTIVGELQSCDGPT